jgi:predicted metalloprotease
MDWEKGEESENLEDRRRMSPRGIAIGGGIGAVVILLIGALLGVDPDKLKQLVGNAPPGAQGGGNGQAEERPPTAQEERSRKFAATILRFTEKVWDEQFSMAGKRYEKPKMVLFTAEVQTGCGNAPSSVGPFYCPADRTVYLDPTFFDTLEQRLGGSKAEFSQAYVIAHEVGHHVQNLLGYSRIVEEKRQALPKAEYNKWSVRLELQADYLAGVWAYHGQKKFNFIEPGDVEGAIKTANAIGDDRLQKHAAGFVSPEKYTHGTSDQRIKWFRQGLETGDMKTMKKLFEVPYDDL